MYTNTVFSAAFCAVPGLTIPISCPSSTTTRHVSVSQGPSSGVYVVSHKLLQCWHTDHKPCIKFFTLAQTHYFYCAQNVKIKRLCNVDCAQSTHARDSTIRTQAHTTNKQIHDIKRGATSHSL
jgi:hypothetical protein